jgi:Glycosyl hydrolases family 16
LGGCDPANSFSIDSCAPAPICKNQTFIFQDFDRLVHVDDYLGDASQFGFVSSGDVRHNSDGELVLALKEGSNGTFLSSTHYIWFGKVSVTLRSSGGHGVVTSLDLFADSKDQISADFVGNDTQTLQLDQNSQGIADGSMLIPLTLCILMTV